MTDEEKVAAIEALCNGPCCAESPAAMTPRETLDRAREVATCILALVRDEPPRVEWAVSSDGTLDRARLGRWEFSVHHVSWDTFQSSVQNDELGLRGASWGHVSRDSAKARALAIYVALRGVT